MLTRRLECSQVSSPHTFASFTFAFTLVCTQVALPCESATGTSFLELYASHILALQVCALKARHVAKQGIMCWHTSDTLYIHVPQLLPPTLRLGSGMLAAAVCPWLRKLK